MAQEAEATCAVDDCEKLAVAAKGRCWMHYKRGLRGADLVAPARRRYDDDSTCEAPGCDRRPLTKGLCGKHWGRFVNHGTTEKLPPTPWQHGSQRSYSKHGCRCDICVTAYQERTARKVAKNAARLTIGDNYEQHLARLRSANDESRETAIRYGYEWTGPELEIAARADLTAREVATMLGRTIDAVNSKRHALRYDPKTQMLAGLSTAGDTPAKAS